MQIVIDIPEEVKHNVHAYGLSLCPRDKEQLINAIKNGKSLPKRHGRLIDADELKKIIQENDVMFTTGFNIRICDINATPTIIEADKEQEE